MILSKENTLRDPCPKPLSITQTLIELRSKLTMWYYIR